MLASRARGAGVKQLGRQKSMQAGVSDLFSLDVSRHSVRAAAASLGVPENKSKPSCVMLRKCAVCAAAFGPASWKQWEAGLR